MKGRGFLTKQGHDDKMQAVKTAWIALAGTASGGPGAPVFGRAGALRADRESLCPGDGPGGLKNWEVFMMNEKIAALLNQQVNKEFYSAYLYLDMANYYDGQDLDGYANYYMIQAQEERDHALQFIQYMQSNDLKVTLEAIDKPDKVFNSPLDPLVVAAEHERYVTSLINEIYHEAHQAKDYRTMKFLDWFVNEQMEEEENADKMVSRYQLFGTDPKGLYLLDQEYASRVYTAPTANA